jgi:23S rRNA (cytosine1962-C5)-methyltransferase
VLFQHEPGVVGANRNSHGHKFYYTLNNPADCVRSCSQRLHAMMIPSVTISARGETRLRGGHPWIYRTDVGEAHAAPGDLVVVKGPRNRTLGRALYSDRSQIAIRVVEYGDQADAAWLTRRIDAALAFRESLAINATAYRLVHGEADLLPSLIVDRYGDYLVVQALSQGMDRLLPEIVRVLGERLAPAGILARNDPRARVLEGLEQRVEVLAGEIPESVTVAEAGIEYEVDLRRGQKTGLFLDQRENREAAAGYARGRLLDCFSYNGGFALVLGRRATETVAIDVSEDAIARVKQNAARNGVAVDARVGNVFDELRGLERLKERFDTIVLDPPAFAKNRGAVPAALRGYREINLRAMRSLAPGGILLTASCSFHVGLPDFLGMLTEAAADSGRRIHLRRILGQGEDHPEVLTIPETSYLKGAVLQAE